jgi:hypothetical protein
MRGLSVPIVLVAVSGVLLLGCPASQTWTTARTVPAGTVQHTAGVEFVGLTWECPESSSGTSSCVQPLGFVAVPFPAYVARIGVADPLDIGLKASSSGSFGLDFKIQVVRTKVFDLALDPGITTPFIFSFMYVNLPIYASLNFGEMLTLTFYPKVSYWLVFQDEVETAIDGFFYGGGANFQIRISERFALTPGFEWARSAQEYAAEGTVTFLNFGIGFTFGSFPEFGDPATLEAAPQQYPAPQPGPAPVQQAPAPIQ